MHQFLQDFMINLAYSVEIIYLIRNEQYSTENIILLIVFLEQIDISWIRLTATSLDLSHSLEDYLDAEHLPGVYRRPLYRAANE